MGFPAKGTASVFAYEGIPPAGQLIPLGLQHVVGVITPALIISGSIVAIVFSIFVKPIRRLFPPLFGMIAGYIAACFVGIVYVVNSVQTIGDLTSTTMGGTDRVPTGRELSDGIIGQGLISVAGVFFGELSVALGKVEVPLGPAAGPHIQLAHHHGHHPAEARRLPAVPPAGPGAGQPGRRGLAGR